MEKVRNVGPFIGKLLMCISVVLILIIGYFHFTKNYKKIDLNGYKSEVEVTHIEYEKIYALPEIYSTKQKLDRIVFDLEYFYKDKKYKSKAIVSWEYVSRKLERIIDNDEVEKLIVKCKNEEPEKVMVFVKE